MPIPTIATAHGTAKRVLLVEDEETVRRRLGEVLQLEGHDVEVAETGAQGIAKARAFRPDVVMIDLGLPDADGVEVAKAIRSDPDLKDVWLVAVTGYSREPEAVGAGFDAYFLKPINIALLTLHLSRNDLTRH